MGLFDKIKNFAGIDTVGVDVVVNEALKNNTKNIKGTVIITGKSDQKVKNVTVNLIEKYKYKGSDNNIVTKDYQLGVVTLYDSFNIKKDEIKKVEFELPITFIEDKGVYSKEEIEAMKKNAGSLSKYVVENTSIFQLAAVVDVEAAKIDPAQRIELKFEN